VVNRLQTSVGARRRLAPTNRSRRDRIPLPGWRGILLALAGSLTILTFGPGLPTAAQETARPSRIDSKSQEILAQCIEALGGDRFLKFRTLYTKGRAFAFFEGETAGMEPFENTTEYPDKRRFSYGKSPPVVLINNGDDGWETDRYGTIRQPLEQLRGWKVASRYSIENLLREVIHEPGLLVQYGGVDFVDAAPASILNLVDAREVRVRIYLHQTSTLPIRITYSLQDPKTHEREDYQDSYSDYQKFQGIETPMHIGHSLNDERISEVYRNQVVYDKPIPPGFFEPENPKGVS
jgi:hypothetical protein